MQSNDNLSKKSKRYLMFTRHALLLRIRKDGVTKAKIFDIQVVHETFKLSFS